MINKELRFYPDGTQSFEFEPTKDRFFIKKLDDHVGEGLMTLVDFYPGQVVFAFTGELMHEITQYTLQVEPGLHIHDPYVMGKVLHCCDPNTICDMSRLTFIARKRIRCGELITMDYDQTEEVLFKPFACSCGAPNCRGYIRGNKIECNKEPEIGNVRQVIV